MSISSQVARSGPFTITALPQTISVGFPFQQGSDLLVLDMGSAAVPHAGVVLTLGSDYTVTGGGYNGSTQMQVGSIVVVSGGANAVQLNDLLVILRGVPINQTSSLAPTEPLTVQVIEKALDKQATLSQELEEQITRCLRFPEGELLDGTLLGPAARASKFLGFDSAGNLTYLTGTSSGGGATYTAGAGLILASNEFSVDPSQSLTDLTVTNPIVGGITGNAATATKLATARNINGIAFDGTANITVPAAASTLTGTTLATNVVASSLTSVAAGTIGTMAIQNANAVAVTGGTINGAAVTGLAAPSGSTDAANKAYVDSISAGIVPRTGCLVATTANITLSGAQTIDGVSVIAGNRVLVKNQTLSKNNGIYDCAAGAWSRSTDSDTAGELLFGYYYFISSGTTQAATSWFIQTPPTVLGTDPVVFSQFSASASYLAGTGIDLTGNTFSIKAAQSSLTLTSSAFNGTIGATTPSSIVATTETVTGNSYLGNLVVKSGQLNETATNATASLFLNYDGYSGGTTQFRDVEIMDGKNAQVAKFTGSTKALAVNGAIAAAGTVSTSSGAFGFSALAFAANVRNPIYFFGNASTYGISYFQGSSGYGGADSIGFHFGTATDAGSSVNVSSTGITVVGGISQTNVLNVRTYGAKGDGATNDTTAIAAAVSALPATNAVLYFPAGIYLSDTVALTGKTGLTVLGDGNGSSTLKHRTGGVVMTVASSTGVNVHDMTFDGNLGVRTAGQTAVTFDVASNLIFTNNTVKNAGQYNILVGGGSTQNTDINITNNVLLGGYADGINLQYVSKFVVANNTIDGVDDDCIAIGYNANGFATYGVVSGNFCRARSDLGTATGRGIWVGKATDILIVGNNVDTVKQTGIWISDDGTGTRPARISVKNNKVRNVATSSGHGIAVYKADYVTLEGNTVENPAQGSCIEIADWNYLTIKGGTLTQAVDVFGRGIHCDESNSWGATWTDLRISEVDIRMLGASTNSCIYLSPDASVTMATGSITNVTGSQVVAGDYISVATARMGTLWKIGNNVTLTASRTVAPASSAGVYTVFNNN